MCEVPATHLFDDPRSIDLYEEHGIVLLPEEETLWLARQARYRPARAAVEVMRGRPGFLKARSNHRDGTVTVWVTDEALWAHRALAGRLGAEDGLELETVRYDLVEMEAFREDILQALPTDVQDLIVEVDIEPDQLVAIVDGEGRAVTRTEAALESQRWRVGEGVELEVRSGTPNRGTGDLCPSRDHCAPRGLVGGG